MNSSTVGRISRLGWLAANWRIVPRSSGLMSANTPDVPRLLLPSLEDCSGPWSFVDRCATTNILQPRWSAKSPPSSGVCRKRYLYIHYLTSSRAVHYIFMSTPETPGRDGNCWMRITGIWDCFDEKQLLSSGLKFRAPANMRPSTIYPRVRAPLRIAIRNMNQPCRSLKV